MSKTVGGGGGGGLNVDNSQDSPVRKSAMYPGERRIYFVFSRGL